MEQQEFIAAKPHRLDQATAEWHSSKEGDIFRETLYLTLQGEEMIVINIQSRTHEDGLSGLFTHIVHCAERSDLRLINPPPHPRENLYGPKPTTTAQLGILFKKCCWYKDEELMSVMQATGTDPQLMNSV